MMQRSAAQRSDKATMPFGWIGLTARLTAQAGADVRFALAEAGVCEGEGLIEDASPIDPAEFLLMCMLVINTVDDEMHGAARSRMMRGSANMVVRAMASTRTLQEAIETAVRFFVIAGAYCRVELATSDDEARILIRSDSGDPQALPVVEELFATFLHIQLSHVLGFLLPVTRFSTTSPWHPHLGGMHPYLRGPVVRSETTELAFPAPYLGFACRARVTGDPKLEGELAWIARHGELDAGVFLGGDADSVSGEVYRRLLERDQAFDTCSMQLGYTPHELRRRLWQEGASFRRMRQAALVERARPLLTAGGKVDDLAEALGYSDGRSFRRALKSATGLGVSELRAAPLSSVTGAAPSVLARLKREESF